jgi:hypothetical protein
MIRLVLRCIITVSESSIDCSVIFWTLGGVVLGSLSAVLRRFGDVTQARVIL